jgi:hypothetical protein
MPQTINAAAKMEDLVSDIRVDVEQVARRLSMAPEHTQERIYLMCLAFIRELAMQADMGAYVNGNMEIANQAREMQETLLTFMTQEG